VSECVQYSVGPLDYGLDCVGIERIALEHLEVGVAEAEFVGASKQRADLMARGQGGTDEIFAGAAASASDADEMQEEAKA